MGVSNLWTILQSCGISIKPESLEGKILAIDISIWLHQALHGCVNPNLSNNKPYLHLVINRLFKLLHYKIKPIFVFDGGIPPLKRKTLLARQEKRSTNASHIDSINKNIIKEKLWSDILKKYTGVENVTKEFKSYDKDMFELPSTNSSTALSEEDIEWNKRKQNIIQALNHLSHSSFIDIDSKSFKILPKDIQHEILQELQFSNKHPSLQNLMDFTDKSAEFSEFQINRLAKRNKVADKIDDINRQMNIEYITKIHNNSQAFKDSTNKTDDAILKELSNAEIQRLASDETVHYVLIKRKSHVPSNLLHMKNEKDFLPEFQAPPIDEEEKNNFDKNLTNETTQENSVDSFRDEQDYPENVQNLAELKSIKSYPIIENHKTSDINGIDRRKKLVKIRKSQLVTRRNNLNKQHISGKLKNSDKSNNFRILKSIKRKILYHKIKFRPCEKMRRTRILMAKIRANNLTKSPTRQPIYHVLNKVDKEFGLEKNETRPTLKAADEVSTKSIHFFPKLPNTSYASLSIDNSQALSVGPSLQMENLSRDDLTTTKWVEGNSRLKSIQEKLAPIVKESFDNVLSLNIEKAKLERYSKTMTEVVYQETQELLKIMGIPWCIAPQEAEAQCAYLDQMGLTQGTITDDSDVWLFGGQRAYRHFFTNSLTKNLEAFHMPHIEKKLGLTRDMLIMIAMMVGSDYTEGIKGIGPVMALQIISEFRINTFSDFLKFKEWLASNRHNFHLNHGTAALKRDKRLADILKRSVEYPTSADAAPITPFKKKILQSASINFPDDFPDPLIYEAYLNPVVDSSSESFTWAYYKTLFHGPDADTVLPISLTQPNTTNQGPRGGKSAYQLLLNFVRDKMRWDAVKLDSYVNPLRKRLEHDDTIQNTIEGYLVPNRRMGGNHGHDFNDFIDDEEISDSSLVKLTNETLPLKRIQRAINLIKYPRKLSITSNEPKSISKNISKRCVDKVVDTTHKIASQNQSRPQKRSRNQNKTQLPSSNNPTNKKGKKKLRFSRPSLQTDFNLNLSEGSE